MKILVLSTDYPCDERPTSLMYVHVRNKYYKSHGIDVTVLNFMAKQNYVLDEISVVTPEYYQKELVENKYDLLVCHAPNIRNHYRFLKKYEKKFDKIIFFFHGHEVLRINKIYPKPYRYQKQASIIKRISQEIYDITKLKLWNKYFYKLINKSYFVFVSQWMFDEFLKWTKFEKSLLIDRYSIIHNCIGEIFEKNDYETSGEKEYDFITIRSFLDGSKYCVDIINQLANSNKNLKFLLIGKGEFFNHYKKADNIVWVDKMLSHREAIEYMNKAKCALMPTRTDAQGLMMCEMASFGIPLITSDLPVCKDIFRKFNNVAFIDNKNPQVDLAEILSNLTSNFQSKKNTTYFADNTSGAEVVLFHCICRS